MQARLALIKPLTAVRLNRRQLGLIPGARWLLDEGLRAALQGNIDPCKSYANSQRANAEHRKSVPHHRVSNHLIGG